jgi:hypothetical protein
MSRPQDAGGRVVAARFAASCAARSREVHPDQATAAKPAKRVFVARWWQNYAQRAHAGRIEVARAPVALAQGPDPAVAPAATV